MEREEEVVELKEGKEVSMRGRSLASSSSSSSSVSKVVRLTQEQRSREAKNACNTLMPNHRARPSTFS